MMGSEKKPSSRRVERFEALDLENGCVGERGGNLQRRNHRRFRCHTTSVNRASNRPPLTGTVISSTTAVGLFVRLLKATCAKREPRSRFDAISCRKAASSPHSHTVKTHLRITRPDNRSQLLLAQFFVVIQRHCDVLGLLRRLWWQHLLHQAATRVSAPSHTQSVAGVPLCATAGSPQEATCRHEGVREEMSLPQFLSGGRWIFVRAWIETCLGSQGYSSPPKAQASVGEKLCRGTR